MTIISVAPPPTVPIPPNPSPNGYISAPITVDPNALLAQAIADIQAQIPGWIPMEGHLETIVLEECAQMMSQIASVASEVPMSIFMAFGQLVGILPHYGVAASCQATFTMIDASGYTIPAGTQISFPISGNQAIIFLVVTDLVIPPGMTAGIVTLIAQDVGSYPNGLAAGTQLQLNQAFIAVSTIITNNVVSGGIDPDTAGSYMNRLADELQLMAPRPILPQDFADMAPNVEGVYRACAIDGLSPGRSVTDGITTSGSTTIGSATANFTADDIGRSVQGTTIPDGAVIATIDSSTQAELDNAHPATTSSTATTLTFGDLTGQERYITVCGVDAAGNALASGINAALLAYLNSKREVNFVVTSVTPTYTQVDVTVTCDAVENASLSAVEAAVEASINNFLSPALWGGGIYQPPEWKAQPVVSLIALADAILTSGGVAFIAMGQLQLCLHGGTLATGDVTLPGDAPLPLPGTITVVVNPA